MDDNGDGKLLEIHATSCIFSINLYYIPLGRRGVRHKRRILSGGAWFRGILMGDSVSVTKKQGLREDRACVNVSTRYGTAA